MRGRLQTCMNCTSWEKHSVSRPRGAGWLDVYCTKTLGSELAAQRIWHSLSRLFLTQTALSPFLSHQFLLFSVIVSCQWYCVPMSSLSKLHKYPSIPCNSYPQNPLQYLRIQQIDDCIYRQTRMMAQICPERLWNCPNPLHPLLS